MHSYLKAIGYSRIKTRQEVNELIKEAVDRAISEKVCTLSNETAAMEAEFECADSVGLIVRGEYDDMDEFHFEHYAPFLRGSQVSTTQKVFVNKRVDTDAYTAMCDDSRIGISLIFFLQNVVDYLKIRDIEVAPRKLEVSLSGLAQEGKIILPTYKTPEIDKILSNKSHKHSEMVAEARKGNRDAMEYLTFEELDIYSEISTRALTEDILSIVDTSLIPYGSESDIYYILANIKTVRYAENRMTGEMLCVMRVECNGLELDICINKEDLLGEPEPGRRFKGNIWLQGRVNFEEWI